MVPIPWRYVNSWGCTACGLCCKAFDVVLRFNEWLSLVRTYGVGTTTASLNKFYIKKKSNGTCIFLYKSYGRWLCGLQHMKPLACKLWPFKILDRPKYGRPSEAFYKYRGKKLFVYIDPFCPEITWGTPSRGFAYNVVPEFIELALGLREKQVYSTSKMLYGTLPSTRYRKRRLV